MKAPCQVCDKPMPKSKLNWKLFGYMYRQYEVCSEDCMWILIDQIDKAKENDGS